MDNIVKLIESLPGLLLLKKATEEQIKSTEHKLGVSFSEDYKEYLLNFGGILAEGIELSGISYSDHRDVVSLTRTAWALNPKVPHSMYVIEDTRVDGIIVWQDYNGTIYKSLPNNEPIKIADSLAAYITSIVNKHEH